MLPVLIKSRLFQFESSGWKILFVFIVLFASCTPIKPHWLDKDGKGEWVMGEKQKKLPSNIRVIEFDELGDLWSIQQRDDAIKRIKAAKKPPLVVTFIHGWRHSASEKDANYNSYKLFIGKLEEATKGQREVIGIYIGWRGGSTMELGGLNKLAFLTIWNRKSATDRLAGIPLGETLWRIKKAASQDKGDSILIGHSLGGRTIERCVGQYIIAAKHRKDGSRNGNQRIRADGIPADLIVLINPASESLYASQMKQALEGWGDKFPAIISVTADSDHATNKIWGAAMHASSIPHLYYGRRKEPLLTSNRHPESIRELQATYLTRTAGHDDRLIDRDVREANPQRVLLSQKQVMAENVRGRTMSDCFWIAPAKDQPAKAYRLVPHTPRDEVYKKEPYGKLNGYWVLSVNSSVLKGHGGTSEKEGVFNTPMMHLMSALYGFARRP